jgi:hypothetical protein
MESLRVSEDALLRAEYRGMSDEQLEAELQTLREQLRQQQRLARTPLKTVAVYNDIEIPYSDYSWAYRQAATLRRPISTEFFTRFENLGFSSFDVTRFYQELAGLRPSTVTFRTSERALEIPSTENKIRLVEEEQEFIRYFRYERTNPRSNKNLNFEVRVPLPFPAEYTEIDVKKHERAADSLADTAMEQFFKQPEIKPGFDPDTWDTLRDDVGWESIARGWEPSRDTEPMSPTRDVNVEAIVEDKTGYWCNSGPVRFRIEGETWTIPDWTS